MFKFVFFAALLAIAAANPGVVAPLAYNALPAVTTLGAYPAYGAAYGTAYRGYGAAYPAYRSWGAYPAVSGYNTVVRSGSPLVAASPLALRTVSPVVAAAPLALRSSVIGAPVVASPYAYSAYNRYY